MIDYIVELCKCISPPRAAFWFYRFMWRLHKSRYGDIGFFEFIDALHTAWNDGTIEEDDFRQEVSLVIHKHFRQTGFIVQTNGYEKYIVRKKVFFFYLASYVVKMFTNKRYIVKSIRKQLEVGNQLHPIVLPCIPETSHNIFLYLLDSKLNKEDTYFTYLLYIACYPYARIGTVLGIDERTVILRKHSLDQRLNIKEI